MSRISVPHDYWRFILVDAVHELPVAFHLTRAFENDVKHLVPLIDELSEKHPAIHDRAEDISGDRGNDDGEDKRTLYENHGILPIIPARDPHAQEDAGDRTLNPRLHDTIYIDDHGDVARKINPFAAKLERPSGANGIQSHSPRETKMRPALPGTLEGDIGV